jgi:hypothetical protein
MGTPLICRLNPGSLKFRASSCAIVASPPLLLMSLPATVLHGRWLQGMLVPVLLQGRQLPSVRLPKLPRVLQRRHQ